MAAETGISKPVKGHCFCKRNSFTLTPKEWKGNQEMVPPHFYYCHCKDCRRASSSTAFLWLQVPVSWMKFEHDLKSDNGDLDKEQVFKAYSSKSDVQRRFCGMCGTQLTWKSTTHTQTEDYPEEMIDVAACALGEDDGQSLRDLLEDKSDIWHFYWNSGLKWWQKEIKGSKAGAGLKYTAGGDSAPLKE